MTNTVYDTTVIAYANGALSGRSQGNALDTRLSLVEQFVRGERVAWYNAKLLDEYGRALTEYRNDVIEVFITRLGDTGRRAQRSTLSRQDHSRATSLRWPTHDQHLLAAAIEATGATILVTETRLNRCRRGIRRIFGVHVELV